MLAETQTPFELVRLDRGIDIRLPHQVIRLESLETGVIHVVHMAIDAKPKPSLCRPNPSGGKAKYRVERSAGHLTFIAKGGRVRFEEGNQTLSFFNEKGQEVLAERDGLSLLPNGSSTNACQGFRSTPGEKLFGLGQFQNGLWDWSGVPLELRQLNCQIAVPVLFSSKNYALLWENASRTEFNPFDQEIVLSGIRQEAGGPTATEQIAGRARSSGTQPALEGQFTPSVTGDYSFGVRNGDRRNLISIEVGGKVINEVRNMWTPSGLEARCHLEANQSVAIKVVASGGGIRLGVRHQTDGFEFKSDFGSSVDYTVFTGPSPSAVMAAYRKAMGQVPLLPKWAYGYWQCRERYSSQDQIVQTIDRFRREKFPVDLIVQDWMYWGNHGWGAYEWDASHYPDPKKLTDDLHERSAKFMISVWCNPSGPVQDELRKQGAWANGWIDVFSQTGRETRWKYLNEAFFSKGVDGWWGDATEPGDPGTDLLGHSTALGEGSQVTGAYPLFASRGLYEGQRATNPDKRVCILTRSAFPGIQRYGSISWSGDINGTWDSFRKQIPAGLNFSLTGVPYWTTDTGGFFRPGNQYQSKEFNELLTRWFQWSAFCPIFRMHGYQTATEFWNYLPETQQIMRKYCELRYQLLPYIYSTAWEVSDRGESIMRPLGYAFPADPKAWDVSDSYMFGKSILVAPVTTAGASTRSVYLPKTSGGWFNYWTREHLVGGQSLTVASPLDQIPLLVRAGSILPTGSVVQSTADRSSELKLQIFAGADGTFDWYDDSGDGYQYETGHRSVVKLSWNDRARRLTIGERVGQFDGMPADVPIQIELTSPGSSSSLMAKSIHYTGKKLIIQL